MASMTSLDLDACPMAVRVKEIQHELRLQLSSALPPGMKRVEQELERAGTCWRALLVRLAGEVGQDVAEELLPASVAMELLYLAMRETLTPGSMYRSVVAGEVLYTRGLSLVARLQREAVQVFADLAEHLVAEKWQMREDDVQVRLLMTTEQAYFEHAFARSAIVLANCCKMGALLGGCSSEVVEALTSYGYALGMAQHIQHDLRVLEEAAMLSFENGMLLLAVIHSVQRSQRTRLLLTTAHAKGQTVSRETLIPCLLDTDSIRYAQTLHESYVKKAKATLSVLPSSLAKELLFDLADRPIEKG